MPFLAASLSLPGTFVASAAAQAGPAGQPVQRGIYDDAIAEAAARFHLPVAWISAVMRAESAGNYRAVSRAGAIGLMQIMPSTWDALSARYALGSDPFDPRANILAGAAYLREMIDRYGDLAVALAAYNAGPGRVDEHRASGRPLPGETLAYVARIVPRVDTADSIRLSALPAIDPFAWRGAALFAAQVSARSNSTATPNNSPAAVVPSAGVGLSRLALPSSLLPPLVHAGPRASGLFVPRAGLSAR